MILNELKLLLAEHPTLSPRFMLPSGWELPEQYVFASIAYIAKTVVDREGITRQEQSCTLQLGMECSDCNNQLDAETLAKVLDYDTGFVPPPDLAVDVEYDDNGVCLFAIAWYEISGAYIDFALTRKYGHFLWNEEIDGAPLSLPTSCC